MTISDEQRTRTLARFDDHQRAWEKNAALRTLYGDWYRRIAAELPPRTLGARVELGSGPGLARQFVPDLELTDIVRAPWHDREVSAEALPFEDGSLGALVLFDVLHHLAAPGRFFGEAARALRPGGRIVLCEPYISLASYPVYKLLHEEPLDLGADPLADHPTKGTRDPFDSNQAIPTILFGRGRRAFTEAFPELAIRHVEHLAGLSYPASGGFSRGSFLPWRAWTMLQRFEARLPKAVFRWVGFRMLVVIERG